MEVPEELKQFIGLKDLNKLPEKYKRYKCPVCHGAGFFTKQCPDCGNEMTELMCPLDHCECSHPITETLAYCPICDAPICPVCGSHDVFQLSRVTGYIQDVGGWGEGKKAELRDRYRYEIKKDGTTEKKGGIK